MTLNRAARRATVSTKLLQAQFEQQTKELQQVRNVLFSLCKEMGRVRFKKATLEGLDEADGINAELDGDTYIVSYQRYPDRKSAG
jgi:hypothetical protein